MNGQNQIGHQQAPIVSVKEWLITNLILMIPMVNLVMIFVWAFSSNTNPNKANYFKAALILFAIVMAIYLVLAVVIFGSIAANQYQ
ncbi:MULTISPECIES: hypothetical protein [Neisseria]|uniref:Uncharacterized protein n=2 Tax=Neisseria TaxID=482 RepID=A0ABN0CAM8_NEIMU|nr:MULTISPECIES: hypothetical protein [Neisseria]EFV80357.1 hypothetical protein HMPREF0604_01172 [Neisseria mucosa C102]OFM22719.1 hypothetical protein HMPREF2711_05040 [Neisseria sp. HMSC070A01]QKI22907.1 hypothetical protein FOC66_08795 [Neisseria mucosa]